MKNIKILVMGLLITVTLGSCKDWLYLEPEDGITVDEYWQSEQDVQAAVYGCYASMLDGGTMPRLLFEWGESRADMITYYKSISGNYINILYGEITPTNGLCKWASFYRTINLCNTVLEKAPGVLQKDDSFTGLKLNAFRGEILGLRALMYFYLTRMYDQVPLVLEATSSDANVTKRGKATRKEIYDQIKKDLAEAEQYCPATYSSNDENKGRITKYAIYTIQADVYLWDEKYQQCIDACNKVINSGQYALVPGDEDWFTTLFVTGNSVEGIFELQFASDIYNPYFDMFETTGLYRANPDVMEYLFPTDVMAAEDEYDVRGDRGSFRSSRNYNVWKYIGLNRSEAKTATEATSNWIVYRYADVLLMKAEALSQIEGKGEESLALIQTIRERAHALTNTSQSPTSRDGLVSYIVDERGREFAFEGKRWFDLLRNAKRDNYRRKDILSDMVVRSAPAERMTTILNKYNDTLSHYFPIPQADIDAAYPLLEQNPFYAE